MILSIVIVNWNTRDLLAACLESIWQSVAALDPLAVQTVVVDNASTDGTAEVVRKRFPWVQLMANNENVGFARANNQAIEASNGRYVLLLNPDTEMRPGALQSLVDFMETTPEAGAAGARLLNLDGSLQHSCHPVPTLSRELWRLFHLDALWPYAGYDMDRWELDEPRAVEVIQGACLMLRRAAIEAVGLLDESYFMYSEEVDLCYRLGKDGWRLFWLPQAQVVHYGGQSTQQIATPMFLHLYQGKLRYFRQHHGWLAAQCYKLILLLAALARLLLSPLVWLARPAQRSQHLVLAGRYGRLLLALPRL